MLKNVTEQFRSSDLTSHAKVAILAGGLGSRLAEVTRAKHKALVDIGGRPVLWHIMSHYSTFGFRDFVIGLGYKRETIETYFTEAGFTPRPQNGATTCRAVTNGRWSVDLVDTGESTENGGRIKRLEPYLGASTFMLTWCDGLADIDLAQLLRFHQAHGRLATLTAVHPPPRFGRLTLGGDEVRTFGEKTVDPDEWINGAFFVLEPGALEFIKGDGSSFERDSLPSLARAGELMAYRHRSFWRCMDTLAEAEALDALWRSGGAPWQIDEPFSPEGQPCAS